MAPHVHRLPEVLANRIAAGEVVERPASVVKELAENAVDAGATRVEVDLRVGGTKLIAVTDNGCGMEREDAVLAVERFATSKISSPEDLYTIETMGFRGEALPSIGAVSRMRITTRTAEGEEGTLVVVEGGIVGRVEAVGCPTGTRVEVGDLFFNTPARRKFLASANTERGHCHEWVLRLAMARPDVAFRLTHENATIFQTTGGRDLLAVLAMAYGHNAARDMIPVLLETPEVTVIGFVSGPRLMRSTRQYQMFFVNRRFVRSRLMSHALTQAYGALLPGGRQPICALHVGVGTEEVDPNVHPTKIEVRFAAEGRIHDVVERAVHEALQEAGLRPRPPAAMTFQGREAPLVADAAEASRLRTSPIADKLDARDDGLGVYEAPLPRTVEREAAAPQARPAAGKHPAGMEVLGQLAGRYIVALAGADLLLIDQHRAAERVLLDRLRGVEQPAKQYIAAPVTVELSPGQAAAAREHGEVLSAFGFELEPFGPTGWLLRSVPAGLEYGAPEASVGELLDELSQWRAPSSAEARAEQVRAMVACHAAVKAGARLSMEEMRGLVRDLLATNSPSVCPHGDPIVLTLSVDDIDRRFERRPTRLTE
jgi:DNA mismatch repair protein MutL